MKGLAEVPDAGLYYTIQIFASERDNLFDLSIMFDMLKRKCARIYYPCQSYSISSMNSLSTDVTL
jgi:hypothetical protein